MYFSYCFDRFQWIPYKNKTITLVLKVALYILHEVVDTKTPPMCQIFDLEILVSLD